MENIRYGRPEASDDVDIELAGVSDFASSLRDGYQTRVGEGGVRLSGGERQRVSIARALLKDPKVLILDTTSAVDPYTESRFRAPRSIL